MNNPMYATLEMQSDDVLNKNITDTLIPDSIVENVRACHQTPLEN